MGSFCDYTENAILNFMFNGTAFTPPTTYYVGLSTTTITDAGGNITEPSGNAYARVAVTKNTTNFPVTASGTISNGADITFATATGSWGTVTDFFIADASTAGNIIGYGTLTTSKAVTSGDTLKFAASSLTISLT